MWKNLGAASKEFTVDPILGGRSDEALDLGEVSTETLRTPTTAPSTQRGS